MRRAYLVRIDAPANAFRFYALSVAPTLFGDWSLIREWGRIGSGGRLRIDQFDDEAAAHRALADLVRAKRKRGYAERVADMRMSVSR